MPDYMRKLWQSGLCPALVPAAFYADGTETRCILKTEGLVRVSDYASLCPDGIEGSFCTLLDMLAGTADSFALLQQWLVDPVWISLHPGDLYYDRRMGKVRLLFSEDADPRPFSERFCEMCGSLGGSGTLIASRLSDRYACLVTEEKGTAAFLRGWRREILTVR
jgi:hypothetical protein